MKKVVGQRRKGSFDTCHWPILKTSFQVSYRQATLSFLPAATPVFPMTSSKRLLLPLSQGLRVQTGTSPWGTQSQVKKKNEYEKQRVCCIPQKLKRHNFSMWYMFRVEAGSIPPIWPLLHLQQRFHCDILTERGIGYFELCSKTNKSHPWFKKVWNACLHLLRNRMTKFLKSLIP